MKKVPLRITQFGSPLLRLKARLLTVSEIRSDVMRQLVSDMEELLIDRKLGVGLAAPQVGESVACALIRIQKTPLRPEAEDFRLVMFNPTILKAYGRKTQLWEGCISGGAGQAGLFAKVPRYKKVEIQYRDEAGVECREIFTGLRAHVIQHEIDHLEGVLFVDKVIDTHSYMTYSEYRKMKLKKTH